jgi:hypothetical protein
VSIAHRIAAAFALLLAVALISGEVIVDEGHALARIPIVIEGDEVLIAAIPIDPRFDLAAMNFHRNFPYMYG